jgi:lysophospholipase
MDLTEAPLYTDIAPGPGDGVARWLVTSDGVRLRIGAWGFGARRGTVFIFAGRSEYVEKYGTAAADLADRGFASITIDWRGQGLADRLTKEPLVGHVETFDDYQTDVAAMQRAARALDLPRPWFLLAHSMGGCIGLRSLLEGLPVKATAFTAPMWGIRIVPHMKPVAWLLGRIMPRVGRGETLPPGTRKEPYVLSDPFEDNMLTSDARMFDMMRDQITAHPELALGGPSYIWLHQALRECIDLAEQSSPRLPCLTFLGTNERIVDTKAVHERMGEWRAGRLEMIEDGEHEVLMETPAIRARIFDDLATHFTAAG